MLELIQRPVGSLVELSFPQSRLIADTFLKRLSYYPRAGKAIRFAQDRLPSQICLADAAGLVGMNPAAFSRYFTEKVGISFFSIVRILRIERALSELERQDCSLTFLAECAGYQSARTFSRAFKSVMGENLTDYRRRLLFASQR